MDNSEKREILNEGRAWEQLRELVRLLDESGCVSIGLRDCLVLMDYLMSNGIVGVGRRVKDSVSVLEDMRRDKVLSIFDSDGKLIAFGNDKEVNNADLDRLHELVSEGEKVVKKVLKGGACIE